MRTLRSDSLGSRCVLPLLLYHPFSFSTLPFCSVSYHRLAFTSPKPVNCVPPRSVLTSFQQQVNSEQRERRLDSMCTARVRRDWSGMCVRICLSMLACVSVHMWTAVACCVCVVYDEGLALIRSGTTQELGREPAGICARGPLYPPTRRPAKKITF